MKKRFSYLLSCLAICIAATFIPGENLVKKFPFRHYIGKDFKNFYTEFKSQADTQHIATQTNLYQPNVLRIEGVEIFAGYYCVKAYFKSAHYFIPDWEHPDSCLQWDCPQFDTAKLNRFEVLKENLVIKTYK